MDDVGLIGIAVLAILLALSVFRKNIFVYLAIFACCVGFIMDDGLNNWVKTAVAILSLYPIGGILMLVFGGEGQV